MDPQGPQAPPAAPNPKQQVVERLRQATNVLVTVSTNPTVDQLAACIGFTLLLNKLEKHATAVFSGQVPSTIEFLKPDETLEKNTDSLRDFIISLDKSKADKLRYKVEENVVKIFITPYRTSLSQNDLDFSQGDFNVDAVVALGVLQREQLDQAIVSHGRILHDATVITISAGQAGSDLGAINWQDSAASSLSEMLVSISEAFQGGLLDGQIATAFLTGIVSETERFSNPKTSPKVMTMAAQLMAAGANQQLIATELQQTFTAPDNPTPAGPGASPATSAKGNDGSLTIPHNPGAADDGARDIPKEGESKDEAKPEEPKDEIHIDEHGTFRSADQVRLASDDGKDRKVVEPLNQSDKPKTELSKLLAQEPDFGGTFTANTDNPDDKLEPSTDALSLPPVDQGLFGQAGGGAAPAPAADNAGDTSAPGVYTPPPLQGPTPTEPPLAPNLPFPPPDIKPDETLLEIEEAVHSPHLQVDEQDNPGAPPSPQPPAGSSSDSGASPDGGPAPLEGVDAARDAVQSAINSIPFDASHPEPVQALNANPMDLPLPGAPTAPPVPDLLPLEGPSHGLLPTQPPVVPTEDGAPIDPLSGGPSGMSDLSSAAFDPTAPPMPAPDPFAPPQGGAPQDPSAPPPVPPPMTGFPMPPQDPNQQ